MLTAELAQVIRINISNAVQMDQLYVNDAFAITDVAISAYDRTAIYFGNFNGVETNCQFALDNSSTITPNTTYGV